VSQSITTPSIPPTYLSQFCQEPCVIHSPVISSNLSPVSVSLSHPVLLCLGAAREASSVLVENPVSLSQAEASADGYGLTAKTSNQFSLSHAEASADGYGLTAKTSNQFEKARRSIMESLSRRLLSNVAVRRLRKTTKEQPKKMFTTAICMTTVCLRDNLHNSGVRCETSLRHPCR
jgi:hypothetical protein